MLWRRGLGHKFKLLVGLCLLTGVCFWSAYRAGLFRRSPVVSPLPTQASNPTTSARSISSVISTSPSASEAWSKSSDSSQAPKVAASGKPESTVDDTPTVIAFRYDKTRVFFPAGDFADFDWDRTKKLKDLGAPTAKNGPEGLWVADAELLRDHHELFNSAQSGEEWQLEISSSSRMAVIIKEPVVAEVVGDAMTGFLAEVTPPDQAKFSASPNQYFLIHRISGASDQRPHQEMSRIGELPNWKATPEERTQIEHLLNARMKTELAGMHHYTYMDEDATRKYPELAEGFEMWRRFDRALVTDEAKLDYDIQAFQLTPDGAPRLFIRAQWTVEQKPAFLMSAWVRTQPNPTVEAADSGSSDVIRIINGYAPNLESLGTVLNVFDRKSDGRGELLILSTGYEGFNIQLFRYTDAGPVGTGISFGGSA